MSTNAFKAAIIGGLLYPKVEPWLRKKIPLKLHQVPVCYYLAVAFFIGPSLVDAVELLTDEEIANAAAEAEQTPAAYVLWLMELKSRQAAQQLDAGVQDAENKQREAQQELQKEVEKATEAKWELEGLKAAAERLLKQEKE